MDTDLIQISNLLRKYEVNIINGSSKLCLTASLLHQINLALQEAEYNQIVINSSSNVTDNVKFLCDIITKVPKLMITQKISSVKYRLDISRFTNLKYLELNNIPVHLVEGIKLFRLQLQVLVCNNVSASLNDIFGTSGVWDSLHTAKLCRNNLESLSQSYSISCLHHLDLSYNRLKGGIDVQPLKTLKYLNLSFNCLTSLPILNKYSYYSLKVIRLNNNFIDDLTTMHLFSGLEILDLSYNLLADHSVLSSIGFLLKLQSINLTNNPITYHPYYRVYFCHYINGNLNLNDLLLDGRLLTTIEKREVARLNCFMHDVVLPKHSTISPSVILNKSCLRSIPKKKVRDAVIGNGFVNTKRSNWSTALDTNMYSLQNKIDIEESRKFRFRKRFSENMMLNKQSQSTTSLEYSMEFNFESITTTTLLNTAHHPLPKLSPIPESLLLTTGTNYLEPSDDNNNKEEALKGESTKIIIFNNEDKMLYFENFDKLYRQLLEFGIKPEHLNSHVEIKTIGNDTYAVDKFETLVNESEDMPIKDYESSSSEETIDELLLAQKKLQDGNSLDVFITLNESNIKEKSTVTGRTLESWSLRSVESCEKLMKNPSIIRLVFTKVRKDFHERIYVMENPDADKLLKRIRLFLEARSLNSMNQIVYRCLKCNSIFSREIQQSVLLSLSASTNDICQHKPTIKCPVCGSALVLIEEDGSLSKHVTDNFSISNTTLPLTKSPSTIGIPEIESIAEEEYKQTGELSLSSPVNDSDIEIISNPSQSSIEVLQVDYQNEVFPAYSSTIRDELKNCIRKNTESNSELNTPDNVSRSVFLDPLPNHKHIVSVCKDKCDKEDKEKSTIPNTYTSVLERLIYCAKAKLTSVNQLR